MSLTSFFQQLFLIKQSINYSASLLAIYLAILFILWLSNILIEE